MPGSPNGRRGDDTRKLDQVDFAQSRGGPQGGVDGPEAQERCASGPQCF